MSPLSGQPINMFLKNYENIWKKNNTGHHPLFKMYFACILFLHIHLT